jgi:uncharacterized spore protein YtfJ
MTTKELIDSAVEHLKASASVKTVYGDPVVVDGKTVIPVAKVAYGFGSGKGKGPDQKGEGEGVGGGVAAKPVGVVEIANGATTFVPIAPNKTALLTAVIATGIGLGLGYFFGSRSRN